MPNATYVPIASVTVGSGGSTTIDFSNIPNTYTDLVLVCSTRADNASPQANLRLNINNSSTDRNFVYVFTAPAETGSASGTDNYAGQQTGGTGTSNTFGSVFFYFPNYAGSATKRFSYESVAPNNSTTAYETRVDFSALRWNSTSAINQLTLANSSTNKFVQYSTATLYGIKSS